MQHEQHMGIYLSFQPDLVLPLKFKVIVRHGTAKVITIVINFRCMSVFLVFFHVLRMRTKEGHVGMVVGVFQHLTCSINSVQYLLSNYWAALQTQWWGSIHVNFDIIERIDQGDIATVPKWPKSDTVTSYQDKVSILVLYAPLAVVY